MPTKDDTTFMLAPASVAEGAAGDVAGGVEDSLVVFCIDISGSMCVTTEVSIESTYNHLYMSSVGSLYTVVSAHEE